MQDSNSIALLLPNIQSNYNSLQTIICLAVWVLYFEWSKPALPQEFVHEGIGSGRRRVVVVIELVTWGSKKASKQIRDSILHRV